MPKFSSRIREKRSTTTNIKDAFRNENGAIDLASIMVGIIVIGLIGGVIAATVFAVIPWSQDNAAKHQLDSIHSAQNAHFGLVSDPSRTLLTGEERNSFANSTILAYSNLLTAGSTYCTEPTDEGKDYTAYSKSSSGTIFISKNSDKKAVPFTGEIIGDCSFLGSGAETPEPAPSEPFVPTVVYSNNFSINATNWYSSANGVSYTNASTINYTGSDAGTHGKVISTYTQNYSPYYLKVTNLNLSPGTYKMTFEDAVFSNLDRPWTADIEGVAATPHTNRYAGWKTATMTFTITEQASSIVLRNGYSYSSSYGHYFDNFVLTKTSE